MIYRSPVPDIEIPEVSLPRFMLERLEQWGDKPALVDGPSGRTLTYGALAGAIRAAAGGLAPRGFGKGDVLAIYSPNLPEYAVAFYGAALAGGSSTTINPLFTEGELSRQLGDAGARLLVTVGPFLETATAAAGRSGVGEVLTFDGAPGSTPFAALLEAGDAPPQVEIEPAQDVVVLPYSSGTTGLPKGVMLTHRNLMTMGLCYFVDVDPVDRGDAIVYAAPLSHGCGLYAIPHLMAGARHVVPASGGVEPAELFALGQALGPLSTFAAPTIVKRLVDHAEAHGLGPADAARAFKTIVYGGAPMYLADIRRALRVMGPRFVQIYGQGETPMVGTALSRRHIADAAHPDHAARLASVGVREGWLWTGDLGSMDAHGFLTLKDRSKDLLISGGSNIYPREVEEVLLTAPGVAEVAVVGAPDPEWGEVVVAFVVAAPGQAGDAAALDAHCLARIARFKRPKRYVFVDALPKNHYGKVLKTELRQRAAQSENPA